MKRSIEKELVSLIGTDPWRMNLLRHARSLRIKDWAIGAGFVRNRVWDALHGDKAATPPTDIDLLFFDPDETSSAYVTGLVERLVTLDDSVLWEPVNQATIHEYNDDRPYTSILDAMSRWAETATAVAVTLDADDELHILAPHGLDDLFAGIVRPHLVTPRGREVYLDRVSNKGWRERWPRLQFLDP